MTELEVQILLAELNLVITEKVIKTLFHESAPF